MIVREGNVYVGIDRFRFTWEYPKKKRREGSW